MTVVNGTLSYEVVIIKIKNKQISSDGQQFIIYQQNERPPPIFFFKLHEAEFTQNTPKTN